MMQDNLPTLTSDLSDLAGLDDRGIDLALAALRIATIEYKQLDARRWLAELDDLAARARDLAPADDEESLLEGVDDALFREAGFHGNDAAYYDPRNSFLNDVLARRTGIPITLSVVYIEVARRAGVRVEGIGFPGHFLVGYYGGTEPVVIDPFRSGARLTHADLEALLGQVTGNDGPLPPSMLRPVSRRQLLLRMLNNLKLIYTERNDFGRAVAVTGHIMQLEPGELIERRDRGLLLLQLGDARAALRDLETYAAADPEGPEIAAVRDAIATARRLLAQLN
jgi:regulator of sirC expression with transglutaminase-like and TPR domain